MKNKKITIEDSIKISNEIFIELCKVIINIKTDLKMNRIIFEKLFRKNPHLLDIDEIEKANEEAKKYMESFGEELIQIIKDNNNIN